MVNEYGVVMVVLDEIGMMMSKGVMTVNGYGLVMGSIFFIKFSFWVLGVVVTLYFC